MNKIFLWLTELFSLRFYTLRNLAVILLVLFCIQYIPIESRSGVSWVKVTAMALMPFVLLRYVVINKALIISLLYSLWIIFTAYILHTPTFRASTVIYLHMYLLTFVTFYTIVWNYHAFSLDFFTRFIKCFIYVLVGVLVLQQVAILFGFKYMPILNLCQVFNRGIGANSLTFEPSSFGRLISILFYSYLKCCEYRSGQKVNITEVLNPEHKWATISYIWAVITMGSGTAFLAMAILSLYFMRGGYIICSLPLFLVAYGAMDYYGNDSFQRAKVVTQSTLTGNAKEVIETDGSAATRITPILNTLNLDLTDSNTWIGHGCDSSLKGGPYSKNKYIGDIGDYGLIAFILCLLLTYTCVTSFASIPSLMMPFGIAGFAGGNVSYFWGMLMILTCVTYFKNQKIKDIDNENYSA